MASRGPNAAVPSLVCAMHTRVVCSAVSACCELADAQYSGTASRAAACLQRHLPAALYGMVILCCCENVRVILSGAAHS
jgi:hypothetical protein